MIEIEIVRPANNAAKPKEHVFKVFARTEAWSSIGDGIATLQFAEDFDGPWFNCRPIGEDGAMQANQVEWDADREEYAIEALVHESIFYRFVIFESDLNDRPEAVSMPRRILAIRG